MDRGASGVDGMREARQDKGGRERLEKNESGSCLRS